MASLDSSSSSGGAGSSSQSAASTLASSSSIEDEAAVEPDIPGQQLATSSLASSTSDFISTSTSTPYNDLATSLAYHQQRHHQQAGPRTNQGSYGRAPGHEQDMDEGHSDSDEDNNDNDNDLIGTPLASSVTTLAAVPSSSAVQVPLAHPTPTRASLVGSSSSYYYYHASSSSSASTSASSTTLSPRFNTDTSLRIPREREPAYGDDHADGDDDGNVEDIEDGDEYDEDDDKYDHLFDIGLGPRPGGIPEPIALPLVSLPVSASNSNSSLFLRESALELRDLGLGGSGNGNEEDMDEIERSFLRCTKPPCSKKELVSCLSSRSTSPGPISPLLSDEDFPSLCSSSTAPSSRRSSDGSHTPRVRFKKGCVITAVNLTWAPQTYDRAPITVAESLDMHRCKSVEDAESAALEDEAAPAATLTIHHQEMLDVDPTGDRTGQWQAFSPEVYAEHELGPAPPPSPPAASSPSTAAHAQYAYASTFGGSGDDVSMSITRTESPEDSAYSSSSSEAPFKYTNHHLHTRNSIGYPTGFAARHHQAAAYDGSSASSSSDSESDCDYDLVERCTKHDHQPVIYRSGARSSTLRPALVSSVATAESSLGAAARELSDSLDESSRDSSPTSSAMLPSASDDCLSSTPKASSGAGPFAWERFVTCSRQSFASFCPSSSSASSSTTSSPVSGNVTHEISPPPQEEQPARKVQRRSDQKGFGACIKKRFCSSDDMWESCEALGGF